MMVRRGYPDAAAGIRELYLAGRKDEAIEAVPDEYCDGTSPHAGANSARWVAGAG